MPEFSFSLFEIHFEALGIATLQENSLTCTGSTTVGMCVSVERGQVTRTGEDRQKLCRNGDPTRSAFTFLQEEIERKSAAKEGPLWKSLVREADV